jgi:hypothetical protein
MRWLYAIVTTPICGLPLAASQRDVAEYKLSAAG